MTVLRRSEEATTRIARVPNRSADFVSSRSDRAGDAQTNTDVRQLPPRDSCRSRVKCESRKGIWGTVVIPAPSVPAFCATSERLARAVMTLPSARSDTFIFWASFNLTPETPVRETRSEPARSTMVNRARIAA
eukprot:scaffold247923_cov28-Tisochrysis_lutea.AAC.2